MSNRKKFFPGYMFVARANEGTREEYFSASQDAAGVLEDDGPMMVATYKLVEVKELSKRVVSKDIHGNY